MAALTAAILNPQTPDLVLRSTTRLVEVNVIVTRNGEPVSGLKKEDFQVFDNGKRQEIRQFSEDTRALLPTAAEPLPPGTFTNQLEQRAGPPAAVTAILLDGLNTEFADQAYARQQVVRFLSQIQPQDRIALYTLDYRGLTVLHDYTTDSSDLLAKLANYRADMGPDKLSAFSDPLNGFLASQGNQLEAARRLDDQIRQTLTAIEFIANGLAGLPGRKNLVWVSAAFPLQIGFGDLPGNGGVATARPGAHRPASADSWTAPTDRTVRALNNANVAIYPVDARGLELPGMGSATAPGLPQSGNSKRFYHNQETMGELAGRTGGRAFWNTEDMAGAIRTAIADSAVTYMLGFYPQNEKFNNSFHNLKVTVSGVPHVELRYRKGYVDQDAPPQDEQQRRAALRDAVLSPMDANGIGLRARVQPTGSHLEVTLRVDPKSVLLNPQGDHWDGKLDLLYVEKDPHGAQTYDLDVTLTLQLLQQNYDRLQKEGLIYRRVLPRADKTSEVKVIVRDAASGAVGSITAPFSSIPSP
ncbi:MAG: VWA domain-containing protein [Bryobacteraceae bacterium]